MLPKSAYVATIGLHASASTWVFNVVRELLSQALGPERVLARYAEVPHELPCKAELADRCLLLKSHHGSPSLDSWLWTVRPTVILSIRDPRDAALSMAQRFHAPLTETTQWLLRDCLRLTRLAAQGHEVLRYEDHFFERPETISRLAALLGPHSSSTEQSDLFERYRTEAVRRFAAQLASLPPDRLMKSDRMMMDRLTQIHRGHIGDTRSGKWRELPRQTQLAMTRLFMPFIQQFHYDI